MKIRNEIVKVFMSSGFVSLTYVIREVSKNLKSDGMSITMDEFSDVIAELNKDGKLENDYNLYKWKRNQK